MSFRYGELLLITVNHESVSMEDRERYSLDEKQIQSLYQRLHQSPDIKESLILNTCNRFELYTKTRDPRNGISIVYQALHDFYKIDTKEIEAHAAVRYGPAAIKHLIEVSAGLRSQITGEAEIFGQVKEAYALCQNLGYAGKMINRMAQKGFQAVKLIRNSTAIGEGKINISNVAVDLSMKIFGALRNTSVLIIGTGEIGEKTAKALRSRGASDFGIASHSTERAEIATHRWGGSPRNLEDILSYLNEYDIVISSTDTGRPILDARNLSETVGARKNRALFLIDLGMPRNFDPSCEEMEDVYLYNLDDLAEIAETNLKERKAAIKRGEEIADQKSISIWKMLESRGLVNSQ